MLITPRKPQGILRIVPDDVKDEPAARRITFICRSLTLQEEGHIGDMLTVDDQGRVSPKLASARLYAVRRALQSIEIGEEVAGVWAAVGVTSGPVPKRGGLVDDEFIGRFDLRIIGEVGRKIQDGATISEDEEGKSEPPSDSEPTSK